MSNASGDRQTKRRLPSPVRVFGVALLLLITGGCLLVLARMNAMRSQASQLLKDAATVNIGDSRADVIRLLGTPDLTYNSGTFTGICYGQRETWFHSIATEVDRIIRREEPVAFDDWPIHIRFDSSGNVDRIKRGKNLIAP